ncbi:FadR/GntR family transcriptional regulator [Capillimicrobium parvum]|uniref:HTH-type transcriptional repressor NanR n=1 Tax=Capillimicrobium parvum TaxID=2884022 RepID=A0A9E6XXG4_9ACTN|nr:FCD domain-containing protein [Capillimicrobium parvum]UGS35542.1 HTH-type transcriptional repressor NanR [Capillimicrobium parvum]
MASDARPAKAKLAYEEIAGLVRRQIVGGELNVGDRLPSETRLALHFGVSRSTIREALRTLQESGFVERVSPRIMVVRRDDDEPVQRELVRALRRNNVTFADLHGALFLLEPELSRLAAERAAPGDIRELEDNLDAQAAHLTDFATWNRLDQEFHLAIADIAGNPALILARAPITQLLMPALDRFMSSERLTGGALARHRRILTEIRHGDGEAAELMTRRHVDEFRQAWEQAGLDPQLPIDDLALEDAPPAGVRAG